VAISRSLVAAAIVVAGALHGAARADSDPAGSSQSAHAPIIDARPIGAVNPTRDDVAVRGASVDAQRVSVVVDGGPLTVLGAPAAVTLVRTSPETYEGTLRVRVVDARGTDAGWRLALRVGLTDVTAHVRSVIADAPSVRGIDAAVDATVGTPRPAVVVRAAPGSGSGAFDVTITLGAHGRPAGDEVRVRPAVTFVIR